MCTKQVLRSKGPTSSGTVAEENIIVVDESKKSAPLDMIQHSKVGFYFETYLTGGTCWHAKAQRYVPNALLKTQYPDD